jgi:hypothetical protein
MFKKLKHRTFLWAGLLLTYFPASGTASPAATPPESAPAQTAAKSIPERLRAIREHVASARASMPGAENGQTFAQWFNFRNGFRKANGR